MGMQESGAVVAVHAVTLAMFLAVSWMWGPWIRRQIGIITANPMGLMVIGFGALAWLTAVSALYYGTARVVQHTTGIGMWTDGWAVIILLMQCAAPVAMLLAMMARWRLDGLSGTEVKARVVGVVLAGAVLWTAVAWVAW
jgi:hypothetical protein